ncbi:MAG: ribose 5-phosphate isomerase B [Clostridiales bacterium]|nr:ribose 5-phosphate isomerase B [Clostridiales bacterium]
MKVVISSDHAGYDLKIKVKEHLEKKGYEVVVLGAVNASDPYSWVEAGQLLSDAIISGECERGIAICGTGIGISLTVNKYKGLRCALCTNEFMARMCRQHNNAQVLAMGARVVGLGVALSMVDAFFEEEFLGERHAVRVNALIEQEERFFK